MCTFFSSFTIKCCLQLKIYCLGLQPSVWCNSFLCSPTLYHWLQLVSSSLVVIAILALAFHALTSCESQLKFKAIHLHDTFLCLDAMRLTHLLAFLTKPSSFLWYRNYLVSKNSFICTEVILHHWSLPCAWTSKCLQMLVRLGGHNGRYLLCIFQTWRLETCCVVAFGVALAFG